MSTLITPIDTGDGLFADTVANILNIIDVANNPGNENLGIEEFYDFDALIINSFPSLAVFWTGHSEEVRTLSQNQRSTLTVLVDVWYYLAEIESDFSETKIRDTTWKLRGILKQFNTLSKMPNVISTQVLGSRNVVRVRGNDSPIAGAVINLAVEVEEVVFIGSKVNVKYG